MIFNANRRANCPGCEAAMLPTASFGFFGWRCPSCRKDWEGGLYAGKRMPAATPAGTEAIGSGARQITGLPFRLTVCPDGAVAFELRFKEHSLTWHLNREQVRFMLDAVLYISSAQDEHLRHIRAGDVFHFRRGDDGSHLARMDSQELALVETTIVKARKCGACGLDLPRGSTVYRADKGKLWGWPWGLVLWKDVRFCRACVEAKPAGEAVRHLRVIDGGKAGAA